ncbi:hypothetical protein A2V71_00950 [Candidatus Berkelbacteria bacterium RBG_13_40_8]|uniref:DUF11 domain-containing protein n=1 Tax=Candidatus Berkelbacteria bacterium RBG_13_40_8 TaxID=1797467 RepID=A0A1F5DP59_9BACT|nr:MAG: hypothetical protein A2V71_00950 [Candidatus Berkelbacteria bacterium RBG_13_40_8]
MVVLSALALYTIFSHPHHVKAQTVGLTQCKTLDQADTTYVLQNDVSSPGTCFIFAASNVTVDLNGKTVTYNTSSGDEVYGFSNMEYGPNGPVHWNLNHLRITNGNIVQGAGKGYKSHAIFFKELSNIEADHLNITYSGDDVEGITAKGSSYDVNAQIHDNKIYPKGGKKSLNHFGGFAAIGVGATGGDIDIYNNEIEGTGYSGISYRYTPLRPMTDTLHITNNTIKMDTPVRDGYAISISSSTGDEIGFEIANNYINQISGRGILINGDYTDDSPGPGTGTIHDNYIEVREAHDTYEYDTAGSSTGITLRFGAHNIEIYNNIVKAFAGQNACPSSFTFNPPDCNAFGLKIHSGLTGKNNKVHNNTVTVNTTDEHRAAGIYAVSNMYNIAEQNDNAVFYNNTITSNNIIVDMADDDGYGSKITFRSNDFNKGTGYTDNFHSILAGAWIGWTLENVFLDNNWLNGATKDDVLLNGSDQAGCAQWGNPPDCWKYSLYTKWYLDVVVKDFNNNAISGANVNTVATGGTSETVSGVTDDQGKAKLELTEYYRYGTSLPVTSNYNNYTPHAVTISKDGFTASNTTVTMDHSQTLDIVLSQDAVTLQKQADKTTAVSGDTITYTISYTVGTQPVTNAVISDNIPNGTTYVSSTNSGVYDAGKVIWNLGDLTAGATGQVSLQVMIQ